MQERLIELNYLSGVADGVFGAGDAERADGIPEPKRPDGGRHGGRKHAQEAERKRKPAAATAELSGNGTMREGDTGEDVYTLQGAAV